MSASERSVAAWILPLTLAAGGAGLTWEILWIHHAGLALGVSAQGAAIVFASVMLGMGAGSLVGGRLLSKLPDLNPLKMYAALELTIGVSGVWLEPGFDMLARLDAQVYQASPALAPVMHLLGIVLLLGVPSFAMGASLPALGSLCARTKFSLGHVYAVQVAGAGFGVLLASMWIIPAVGMELTAGLASTINVTVALSAMLLSTRVQLDDEPSAGEETATASTLLTGRGAMAIAFATGFATFVLEVTWFRSLRAAYQATTESSALILAAALIGLALGGHLASLLRRRTTVSLGPILIAAGIVTLLASPLVERIDLFLAEVDKFGRESFRFSYFEHMLFRFTPALVLLAIPFMLIGVGLPWLLDREPRSRSVAKLYAINTFGGVLGSIAAGWVLIPTIGAVRAGWLGSVAIMGAAALISEKRRQPIIAVGLVLGLAVAFTMESGVGRTRLQTNEVWYQGSKIVETREDPDSTVTVAVLPEGERALMIDGFYASAQVRAAQYMIWMGRLPMLMHPNPKNALVICFGTGQTANAVRNEGPELLNIADISPAVLGMAHHFALNNKVLEDPRVKAIAMDGRAWLRRSGVKYDVVTLEPMPPTFAGSNALYSKEFYELIRDHSNEGAAVAQWLPFHILTPEQSASIVATFVEVYEDSTLWIAPRSLTGILLGRTTPQGISYKDHEHYWPGLQRKPETPRELSEQAIYDGLVYGPEVLKRYAQLGTVVTDDNQHLSYGIGRMRAFSEGPSLQEHHFAILNKIATETEKALEASRTEEPTPPEVAPDAPPAP